MARSRYFEDTVVINEDQVRSYLIDDADGPTELDILVLRLQGAAEPRNAQYVMVSSILSWIDAFPGHPSLNAVGLKRMVPKNPRCSSSSSLYLLRPAGHLWLPSACACLNKSILSSCQGTALFWSGYEKNPLTALAAVCILHWYNFEGPEHVPTDTSGFGGMLE